MSFVINRITQKKVAAAARKLHRSYRLDGNEQSFPWRNPRTPYRIFIAEFLLVRTRADIVARLFPTFMANYPDIQALSVADETTLAKILEGLGLRKRVPYLKKAAQYIIEHHNGLIPEKVEELLKVPGFGAYSAVAVAAFAYSLREVPADVNILRFLSRLTGLPMLHKTKGSKELWALLPELSPKHTGEAATPEQVLDFSRLICRGGTPRCDLCPLRPDCIYFANLTVGT